MHAGKYVIIYINMSARELIRYFLLLKKLELPVCEPESADQVCDKSTEAKT